MDARAVMWAALLVASLFFVLGAAIAHGDPTVTTPLGIVKGVTTIFPCPSSASGPSSLPSTAEIFHNGRQFTL